ncbi:MAG: c-type cytochrome [Proteobacteria bacterium]|nr:c-type cytochrome [Pseudomonadota bacterium]MDA0928159.1 c-type cytochrome [Pseudomonadota bacterium]
MTLAVVIFLLVVATIIFHFASPWWFTDIAADWSTIDLTISITFWVTGFVFIACNLFMAYCVWKFRQKEGHKAVYEPENHKLEAGLSIFTTIGVIAMLAPGLFVWATFVTPPENAAEYEVLGQQWQWQFRYPGADGILGTADTEFVSESNPFGVNPADPNGRDDVIVNDPDMHLPVNQPVKALLRSNDVLHNYTVAQFRVKMDLVPGLTSYLWFDPTEVGTYDILCEELCGIGHFIMRGSVTIDTQEDFDAWLANQPTFAETQSMAAPNLAAGQAQYAACAACHGQNGEGNQALNAPKLAGQQAWYIERQLNHFKVGARGGEGDTNGAQMVAFAGMLTTDEAVRNVAAYISSLPDTPAPTTVTGDIDNGYDIYDRNCAACHLDDGAGTWYTDAPKLSGMSDWYFVTQISNFRAGIRGLHSEDDYGEQMVAMATAMADAQEIADVAAYINTLR